MKKHKRKTFISFFSLFLLIGITSSAALASTTNNSNNTTLVASSHSSTSTQPQFNTNWDMFDSLNGDILNQSSGDEIDWSNKTGSPGIYFEDDFAYTNSKKTVLLGMNPDSGRTSVTIPSSVTEIRGYTKINSSVRESVKNKIGAFEMNTHLEEVTISGTNVKIDNNSFKNCTNLTKVTIVNNGVKSIGDSAFENCISLEEINLPNSLTTIGDSAFKSTSELTTLDFPNNLNKIGKSAFESSGLTLANLSRTKIRNIESSVFKNCRSLTNVNFSNSTISIGSSAFEDTAITNLTITSSLTSLGTSAFKGCTSLVSFSITGRNTNISSIPESIFEGCYKLENVNLGSKSNFKTIGNKAFKSTKIKSLDLKSTRSIGDSAFEDCNELEYFTSVGVLGTIGNNAFKNSSLSEITTYGYSRNDGNVNLQNILTIGSSAFYGTKIKTVETGSHLTTIGDDSFKNIESLTKVDFSKSKLLVKNENAFDDHSKSKVTWPKKSTLRRPTIF